MDGAELPAATNIHYVEQGLDLLGHLDDATFVDCPQSPFPGGAGAQLRHCIDFYDSCLAGLPEGRIDYAKRNRNPRIETDRGLAERELRELAGDLAELDRPRASRELVVRVEAAPDDGAGTGWVRSTARRELEFLVSHTIHHYALIAILLHHQGVTIPVELNGFGVAPSTLRHWKRSGVLPG